MGERTGVELLDELREAICYYTVFPSDQAADAVVLWIAATHAVTVFDAAPRIHFTGPEKRCGKSRALDMVIATCHNPLVTTDATVAAVFRSIGEDPPTLIFDEVDAIFPGPGKKGADQNEDLRSLINAGFQRNRPAIRCVGPNNDVKKFPTFAMAALAGIGELPDTVTDRSVVIRMRRRAPGENAAPYRLTRDHTALRALGDQVGAWVKTQHAALHTLVPAMPVEDRAADLWEPLITLADVVGGTWPERARTAAVVLSRESDADAGEATLGIRMLADCREIFTTGPIEVTSEELAAQLRAVTDAPWDAFALTPRAMAHRLKPYGIAPRQIRPSGGGREEKQVRGYRAADFIDAFARYLPPPARGSDSSVTPSHAQLTLVGAHNGVTDTSVTPINGAPANSAPNRLARDGVTDRSVTPNPTVTGPTSACDGVTDKTGPQAGPEPLPAPGGWPATPHQRAVNDPT